MFKKIIISSLVFFFAEHISAQDLNLYEKKIFISKGDTMPYRLLIPEGYDPSKTYPIILFLHGAGEVGNNNTTQLVNCGKAFLRDSIRKNYPAFVLVPQCAKNDTWANATRKVTKAGKIERTFFEKGKPTKDMQLLQKLLKQIIHGYSVDNRRVYVGGLSMGGMGTYEIVRRNPRLFAAAFPICGGANVAIVPKLKHVNWWVFHGADDKTVSPEYDENMVTAMKGLNIPVQFSLYPNTGHNSWDKAFDETGLFSWIFSNSKK